MSLGARVGDMSNKALAVRVRQAAEHCAHGGGAGLTVCEKACILWAALGTRYCHLERFFVGYNRIAVSGAKSSTSGLLLLTETFWGKWVPTYQVSRTLLV